MLFTIKHHILANIKQTKYIFLVANFISISFWENSLSWKEHFTSEGENVQQLVSPQSPFTANLAAGNKKHLENCFFSGNYLIARIICRKKTLVYVMQVKYQYLLKTIHPRIHKFFKVNCVFDDFCKSILTFPSTKWPQYSVYMYDLNKHF